MVLSDIMRLPPFEILRNVYVCLTQKKNGPNFIAKSSTETKNLFLIDP